MSEEIKYRGFCIEFRALWSNEKSYFSQKRFQRSWLFFSALIPQVAYIWMHIKTLTPLELLMLTSPLFAMSGYLVNVTQKEKKNDEIKP